MFFTPPGVVGVFPVSPSGAARTPRIAGFLNSADTPVSGIQNHSRQTESFIHSYQAGIPMNRTAIVSLLAACLLGVGHPRAQEENSLNRDEVSQIKKKLVAAFEALGSAPAGYAMERESYNLPTQASKVQETGRWYPTGSSADREYGTEKAAKAQSKSMEKEYEKKFAEAQAKGDYQELARLAQEMQKKAGEANLKAVETKKEPINVDVNFNYGSGATIDPDAVVFEKPGVIALRSTDGGETEKVRVTVYFDPVSLKNTKQLSRVEMKTPEGGITRRSSVLNITIQLHGPTAEVEAWAKKIDTGKVLAQIDAAK
jgi:hypothetical protein